MARIHYVGGAYNSTSGFTAYNPCDVYSAGVAWVNGNTDSAGLTRVYVISVGLSYLTGSAFAFLNKDGVETAGGGWVNSGGTFTFAFRKTAANNSYFGRNTAAGGTVMSSRGGSGWAGTLCGTVEWCTVATPPPSITVGPHPTEALGATISFPGTGDDGGTTFNGYIVYASKNGAARTVVSGVSGSLSRTITGLEADASYVFSVSSNNGVGESALRTSGTPYIPTDPANINRYNGTIMDDAILSRYDGAVNQQAKLRVWNGSAFVDSK